MKLALLWLLWTSPEELSSRAVELAKQQRFAEAEKLWQQALSASPGFFPAAFNLGFMHYSQREYAKAEPYLMQAVRSQPKDFNARYVLGSTLSSLGRVDDALRQWRAALELRPDHLKLMQIMMVEYGKGRYFRESAALADRALAITKDDPSVFLVAIKAHQDAADHAAALRVAEALVKRFPDLPRAKFEYGYELHRNVRSEEALQWLEKAMAADPSYEEPFFFYGEILVSRRRFTEAIAPLRKAIEIRRDYMAAWVALARALMGAGRHEEARAELLRAIEINPSHPQPHLLLSQVFFRLGEEGAAAKEKEISLELRRRNPEAMESAQPRPFK
jgi:tetratricopeptide (TPR) repeat protein